METKVHCSVMSSYHCSILNDLQYFGNKKNLRLVKEYSLRICNQLHFQKSNLFLSIESPYNSYDVKVQNADQENKYSELANTYSGNSQGEQIL